MKRYLIYRPTYERQVNAFDTATQELAEAATREKAESLAETLRNYGCVVSGVEQDDEGWFIIRGRRPHLRLSAFNYDGNPAVITTGNLIFTGKEIDRQWTDGGEDADWIEFQRDSIEVLENYAHLSA